MRTVLIRTSGILAWEDTGFNVICPWLDVCQDGCAALTLRDSWNTDGQCWERGTHYYCQAGGFSIGEPEGESDASDAGND